MDTRSPKLNPLQGIALLFFLLAIPVGIYFFQTQNVGETRSQAGSSPSIVDRANLQEKKAAAERAKAAAKAAAAAAPAYVAPTPTPPPTQRCNTSCTIDKDCSADGDMVCMKLDGVGKCRSAQCSTVSDCWCNKTVSCNTACTANDQCGVEKVCANISGVGKCRSSECYGAEDCMCFTIGVSPTPTPALPNRCNTTCVNSPDCGTGMVCVETAEGNKCRDSQCYGASNCLCYSTLTLPTPIIPTPVDYVYRTPTPIRISPQKPLPTPTPTISSILLAELLSSPTPTPFPLLNMAQPILTIDPFYNSKKEANPMITLSGTSDPDSELDISIAPDGTFITLTADSLGNWKYVLPKKLTNGDKQLTIISRTAKGGQMTKTETFTVKGGFQFPFAAVVFTLLIALGVGGYILYQKKMGASKLPPPEPFIPTTTEEFRQPEAIPAEEQPTTSVPETSSTLPVGSNQTEPPPASNYTPGV